MVSGKPPRRSKSSNDPVTIDLTADAVVGNGPPQADTVSDSTTTAGTQPDATVIDAASPEDQVTATPDEPAPAERPSIEQPEEEAVRAEAASEAEAAGAPEPATPAAQPAARSGPAMPALIAAGIFGGLVALAGAGSMQYAGYLPTVAPETAAPADTSGLTAEIEALKAQVAGLSSPGPATADPQLEQRLSALEGTVANQTAAAPDTAAIDELRQKLDAADQAIAALRSEMTGNAGAVGELETRLTERLAEAEKKLEEPRTDVEMAKAIALTTLKAATERGGPFMAELDALAGISPDDPVVANLRAYAATGVASRAELVRAFGDVADSVLAAIHQPDPNEGVAQRLLSSALSVVKVRPVGNVEGATPEAILARMEDKLQNGDLKGAALEWESLPEAGKAVSTDYVAKLKTRIEIEAQVGDALATVVAGKKG